MIFCPGALVDGSALAGLGMTLDCVSTSWQATNGAYSA
jgi:hypothetical protein